MVQDMHRLSDLNVRVCRTRISQMKAANPAGQIEPLPSRWTFWLSRDFAHPRRENRRMAALALDSPVFSTRGENLCEVGLRQPR
jgi:hypothetical protein